MRAVIDDTLDRADRGRTMVRRYNRLLVAFYVVTDALLGDVGVRRWRTASASRAD